MGITVITNVAPTLTAILVALSLLVVARVRLR